MDQQPSPWMTREEVAAYCKVTPGTISVWQRENEFPHHKKNGGSVRYHREDVDVWIRTKDE